VRFRRACLSLCIAWSLAGAGALAGCAAPPDATETAPQAVQPQPAQKNAPQAAHQETASFSASSHSASSLSRADGNNLLLGNPSGAGKNSGAHQDNFLL